MEGEELHHCTVSDGPRVVCEAVQQRLQQLSHEGPYAGGGKFGCQLRHACARSLAYCVVVRTSRLDIIAHLQQRGSYKVIREISNRR